MDNVEMKDVVKQRHPAKDQQNTAQAALRFGLVDQAQNDGRGSECHEQVVERRRILRVLKKEIAVRESVG